LGYKLLLAIGQILNISGCCAYQRCKLQESVIRVWDGGGLKTAVVVRRLEAVWIAALRSQRRFGVKKRGFESLL
jgi:hypothetical protein